MPDIAAALDAQHEVFTANAEDWAIEERRFHGGYPMLTELERFTNETDPSYKSRQRQSPLLNFGKIQAQIVVGHLNEVAPIPNYGTLGVVRERKAIPRGRETPAELFHYNANGVGSNGLQFTALSSGIQLRSLVTGFRWTMVEMPFRDNPNAPVRGTDIRAGFRPFIVEYSPRAVPMWHMTDGQLNWAVIRQRWQPRGEWMPSITQRGYYLLVRQGYDGLGDEFANGGWWLFDPEKQRIANGNWNRTKGEIPLTMYMADESEGTDEHPAVSTMPLMELNQLSSGLMNRISERNWNARQAAKSQKYVLGAEPKTFNKMVEHVMAGNYLIPVEGGATPDGKWLIPQIYDGANGAVESSVYATIITSTIAEAHEIMVRQVTSTPESSGRSKDAGFSEATSPMLSALAIRRETWENTVIPWVEGRAGADQPKGFVMWPTEFDITPIVEKINRFRDGMLKIGARSPTLEAKMVEAEAMDQGMWPDNEPDADIVRDELMTSLTSIRPEQADSVQKLTSSGGSLEGAANAAGIADDDITLLVGGPTDGSVDQTLPEAGAVVAGDGEPETVSNRPADGGVDGFPTPQPNAPAGVRDAPTGNASEGTATASRASEPAPAPEVDLTPVTDRLDALTDQIAALVAALNTVPREPAPAPQPPAPIILPIMVPQQAVGKRVSVTAPATDTEPARTFTVDVQPTDNGTQPNAEPAR